MSAVDFATQRWIAWQLEYIACALGSRCFETKNPFRIVLLMPDMIEVAVEAQPSLGILYVSIPARHVAVAVHGSRPARLATIINRELRKSVARPDHVVVLEEDSDERQLVRRHDFAVRLENCAEAAKIAERLASREAERLKKSLVTV
jgi:hypothetical protein